MLHRVLIALGLCVPALSVFLRRPQSPAPFAGTPNLDE